VPKQSPEELARLIGLRIAELREARGLKQQDLASLARVTVQWLSRVENGKENLTLATLVKLSDALEVEVVDLLASPANPLRKVRPGRPRKD
jgi:transcriptional regulator with XRE-family HTH domain